MDKDEELADHARRIKRLEDKVAAFEDFFRSLAPHKKQEPERPNGPQENPPQWVQVSGGLKFPVEPGDDPEEVAKFWRKVRDGELAAPEPPAS